MSSTIILAALLLTTGLSSAQFTIDPSTCIDSAGYTSCTNSISSSLSTADSQCGCIVVNGSPDCTNANTDCVDGAYCSYLGAAINCALTSCWNQVYSCGYQQLLVNADTGCGVAGGVFPPFALSGPQNPGACSCPISSVYFVNNVIRDEYSPCEEAVGATLNGDCNCCSISGHLSMLSFLCPETDPNAMPSFYSSQIGGTTASAAFASQCSTILPGATCTASPLNFEAPYTISSGTTVSMSYYPPGQIPAPGTASISDGPGSVAAVPTLLATPLTWTYIPGATPVVYTVTAVSTGGAAAPAQTSSSPASPSKSSVGAAGSAQVTSSGKAGSTSTAAGTSSSTSSTSHALFGIVVPKSGGLLGALAVAAFLAW